MWTVDAQQRMRFQQECNALAQRQQQSCAQPPHWAQPMQPAQQQLMQHWLAQQQQQQQQWAAQLEQQWLQRQWEPLPPSLHAQQSMCKMAIAPPSPIWHGATAAPDLCRGLSAAAAPFTPSVAVPAAAPEEAGAPNVEPAKRFRRQVLKNNTAHKYDKLRPGPECVRCGMTAEEHAQVFAHDVKRQPLEKHHIEPVRKGDAAKAADPSNLKTLCHMCHVEWHVCWERHAKWRTYMAATPYCQIIPTVGVQKEAPPAQLSCCHRCGISAARCKELRPDATAFAPFRESKGVEDDTVSLCFWCRKEWSIFWACQRPNVEDFLRAERFFEGPQFNERFSEGPQLPRDGQGGGAGSSSAA
jgi:hypothetical protein